GHFVAHPVCSLVRDRVVVHRDGLAILLQSFGFNHGASTDADLVFDVRMLPNPYWDASLRQYSGCDQPVIDFLLEQNDTRHILDDIERLLLSWLPCYEANERSYINVAIGCTDCQARSVFAVE